MVTKNNTSLSIFISELRNLEKENIHKKIMIEKRKLYAEKDITYSKVLMLIYFMLNEIDVDPMIFVKSCASSDISIKKAGYLGLTLCKNHNLLILTVNTIMKDLQSPLFRESALNFLCNIEVKQKIYSDLTDFICISSTVDKNIGKGVIAKNRLTNLNSLSIVGNNDQLAFVKLQILYDKIIYNEKFNIFENDIFFIISIYNTIRCPYFKVKLVQMYKELYKKKKLVARAGFFADLEADIITPTETVKPTVQIALSTEICEIFILMGNMTSKVEYFLCRLVDSKNPNSRFVGFRLARKYNLFNEKLIDRSIKLGINVTYAFESLISLISRQNYKEIYRRKEEMRFVMDRNLVDYKKSQDLILDVLLKVIKFADEDFISKVYLINPEIAFKKDISLIISEKCMLDLFTKILNNPSLPGIYLFYSILPLNLKDRKFLEEIFTSHLTLLVSKKYSEKILILEKMILTICKLKDVDFFRNKLKDKFVEIWRTNQSLEILHTLLNGIFLMNSKSKEKIFHISGEHFIFYKVSTDKMLKLRIESSIKISEIVDDKLKKISFNNYSDEGIISFYVDQSKKISLTLHIHGEVYFKTIHLNTN